MDFTLQNICDSVLTALEKHEKGKKKREGSFRIKIKTGSKNRMGLLTKNLISDASIFVLENRLGLGFSHWVFSLPHLMA